MSDIVFDKPDFATLRHTKPQWVIDQLVEQTTRQGAEIHRLNSEVSSLKTELACVQSELESLRMEAAPYEAAPDEAQAAEQKELI